MRSAKRLPLAAVPIARGILRVDLFDEEVLNVRLERGQPPGDPVVVPDDDAGNAGQRRARAPRSRAPRSRRGTRPRASAGRGADRWRGSAGRWRCASRRGPRSCCRGPRRRSRGPRARRRPRSSALPGAGRRKTGDADGARRRRRRRPLLRRSGSSGSEAAGGSSSAARSGPTASTKRARRISSRALPARSQAIIFPQTRLSTGVHGSGVDAQDPELDRPRRGARQERVDAARRTPRGARRASARELRHGGLGRAPESDRPQETVASGTRPSPRISASRPEPTRRSNSICQSRSRACTYPSPNIASGIELAPGSSARRGRRSRSGSARRARRRGRAPLSRGNVRQTAYADVQRGGEDGDRRQAARRTLFKPEARCLSSTAGRRRSSSRSWTRESVSCADERPDEAEEHVPLRVPRRPACRGRRPRRIRSASAVHHSTNS